MIATANQILAILTMLSQAFLLLGLLYYLINYSKKDDPLIRFFHKRSVLFSFIVALVAALSSLFYSEIAGYEPCKLCWLQRIFMYPLVILLFVSLIRRQNISDYILSLAIPGAAIALYHNYIYFGGSFLAACTASGLSESCARRFVFLYDYISIPMMALTAFLLIIFLFIIRIRHS